MNRSVLNKLFFAVLFIVFAQSCDNESQKKEKAYQEKMAQIKQDIIKALSDMPPPSTIPEILAEIGTPYHPNIIHDLSRLEDYLDDDDQSAFNLGVYAADISYLIRYDRVHESIEHLDACKRLSDSLGVAAAFDLQTLHDYELKKEKHDELIDLMNETILEAQHSLTESNRIPMAALVLTGSFIEGLYLAVMTMELYPNSPNKVQEIQPIIKIILGEEKALLDIIEMLKDLPQDAKIASVMVELEVLEKLYRSDLESNPDTLITPDMIRDVTYEIKRIRKKITS
jgi:hypothetical protein